jgi:DNA-binding transcriptional ArsR family regulator
MISQVLTQEVCLMEAELCSAFSDPTRILILYELDEQPRTVTELKDDLNLTQPTVSRHLKVLRDRGLVMAERQGTTMHYHLTDQRLIDALDILRSVLRDRIMHRANLMEELNELA